MSLHTSLEFDPRLYLSTELHAGHGKRVLERVRDLSSPLALRRIERVAMRIAQPAEGDTAVQLQRRDQFVTGGLLALDAISYAFKRRKTNGVDPLTSFFGDEPNDYLETPVDETHASRILYGVIDEARLSIVSINPLIDAVTQPEQDSMLKLYAEGGVASTALELKRIYELSGL